MARIGCLDSLKWFAIMLVVVGHFLDYGTAYSDSYKSLDIFIYSFHMPLFIFLAGLFDKPREKFPWDSVVFYIVLGVVLQMVYFCLGSFLGRNPSFNLFSYSGLPWFMFAMAGWKALSYILAGRSTLFIIVLSVALGVIVRYDSNLNYDLFHIGRIIIFFPFYFAGFVMKAESVVSQLKKPVFIVSSCAAIIVFLAVCFALPDYMYQFRSIFTAHAPYDASPLKTPGYINQLIAYAIAAVMCISFISVFSRIKCHITETFGKRTLAVYAWHFPVIYFLEYFGVNSILLNGASSFGGYIWAVVGVATAIILSFRVFQIPLDSLRSALKRV